MAFVHHKTVLTLEQIRKELHAITDVDSGTGFLYFFLNYVYVEHPKGYVCMKDEAFEWQKAAATAFLESRYVISKKRRQVGYSTFVGAYCLWRALFFPSQIINIVSLKLQDSTTFLRRTKFIYDHLPVWMRQNKSEDMKTSMTFSHNGSKITSLPLTENPARGETLSLFVIDEFADMKGASGVLSAGVPALAAGSTLPWTNKSLPSQLFIISTYPDDNPTSNEYVRILNEAREGKNTAYAVIDVTVDDIPYYQDEGWLSEQRTILGDRKFRTQILGEEPLDSENTLIATNVLQRLTQIAPIRCDFLLPKDIDEEGFMDDLKSATEMEDEFDESFHYIKGLWIWANPITDPHDKNNSHEYLITADVAAGKNGNYSAFHVIDLDALPLEQVAEYQSNKIDTETYRKIIEVVAKYYNNAKVSVENNSMGVSICEYFAKNYQHFYFHRKTKKLYEDGFPMSGSTRGPSISYMQKLISADEIQINSLRSINQLRNFGYTKQGKIAGMDGANDDLVMALCQAAYLINMGWAVTSKQTMDDKPLAFLGEGNLGTKEEEEGIKAKPKILKYWEDRFDLSSLSEEKMDMLRMIAESGSVISDEDVANLICERRY